MINIKSTTVKREELIMLKQTLLANNANVFIRNTKGRLEYLKCLDSLLGGKITLFQEKACLGLLLSDASIQYSANGIKARLKMQQSKINIGFLEHILLEILPEWCAATSPQQVSKNRPNKVEIQTFTHTVFKDLSSSAYSSKTNKSLKTISPDFFNDLDPVVVAYWFAGDGGKVDYSSQNRKGLALHTQGLDKASIESLHLALTKNFGWKVTIKNESLPLIAQNANKEQWWLQISGESYDDFIMQVGPYIPLTIAHKLPSPRKDTSTFGFINKALFDKTVSSAFLNGVNNLIASYE